MNPAWLGLIVTSLGALYALACRRKLGGVAEVKPLLADLKLQMLQGHFLLRAGGKKLDAAIACAVEDVNDRRLREVGREALAQARRAWAAQSTAGPLVFVPDGPPDPYMEHHREFVAVANESGRRSIDAIESAEDRIRRLLRRYLIHR